MSLCSRCGASLPDDGLFCQECGAAASQTNATARPSDEGQESAGSAEAAVTEGPGDQVLPFPENIAGVVAYITIIPAIVFLFLDPFKRNFFVRFHSFQHVFLWVAGFASGIAMGILGAILQLIPFMRVLVFPLAGLIGLAWFFLWVLLVVKAYQHETFKLPIIGDLAEERAMR